MDAPQPDWQRQLILEGLKNLLTTHVPESPLLTIGSLAGAVASSASALQRVATPQASLPAAPAGSPDPAATPAALPLADQTEAVPTSSQPEASCFVSDSCFSFYYQLFLTNTENKLLSNPCVQAATEPKTDLDNYEKEAYTALLKSKAKAKAKATRPRPKPKSQLQSKLPRSKPKQRHRQWFPGHLAKLPAKDTMVCHLKVAHMAASDVEETSKDAANACSQGMVVCDSAAGQIGPIDTKPWKPTSEWAQVTAQLSNQAICTGDAKRFAKGDVQIGLALKPREPFLKSSHVLKKVVAWWHCIFSDITQQPCWRCTLIHLLASCDNQM